MTTKQLFQGIKVCLFGILLLVTFSKAKAQEAAFDQGSKTLGVSLGVGDGENGYDYYGDDSHTGLPALAVTYDQGIVGDVGPGTIGVGGIVAWKEAYDNYNGGKASWSSFMVGVRGDYHLTILKDRNNKFDPYAGLTIGARFNHFHDSGSDYTSNTSDPIVAPFIGAKYNFAQNVGVFAEASFDISLLRAGINFNF